MADSCVFCPIVADNSLATMVYEWSDAIAFLPRPDRQGRRGCTQGHILVIPRGHVPDASVEPALTGVVAARAAELAAAEYGSNFHLVTNCGELAEQTVPHLHWHIVPRRPGDGLLMPWTGTPVIEAVRAFLAGWDGDGGEEWESVRKLVAKYLRPIVRDVSAPTERPGSASLITVADKFGGAPGVR